MEFEFEELECLTAEVVNSMVIHSTLSGLRRARANKKFLEVKESEKLPTLTYIESYDPKTGESVQEVHALSTDISRFLLLHSLE